MKTRKILLAGLILIIMTACSSRLDDWEEGVLTIDFGQKSTTGLFYKIDINGPVKMTREAKSGDDNIQVKLRVGVYTITVIAYSDFVGGTVYAEGSEIVEVMSGLFKDVTITLTSSAKAITAFTFPTTPESIGIIDEIAETINVSVPIGTDITKLTPSVSLSNPLGASYTPTGEQNFTSPVDYTVTALDGSTVVYKVTVTVRDVAQWARSAEAASSYSVFNAVAVDSLGNVYAAGYQNGNGTFNYGNGVTAQGANSGGYNVVLVKYDSNGAAQWAKSTSAGGSSQFNAVAVDKDGNVYAAGRQDGNGPFNYGNGVTATGVHTSYNVVLVKYKSDGTALWAKSTSVASNNSVFNAVAVDNAGNVYAAGYQNGNSQFNYETGVSAQGVHSGDNVVLVKYKSDDGTALWAQSTQGASGNSVFKAVAVDNAGNVYAAGYQNDNSQFNYGGTANAQGVHTSSNVALVKYNSSGAALWAKSTSVASNNSVFNAVAVDNAGNVYAAGYQTGISQFNYGGTANAQGVHTSANVALVKYNSDGDAQWARSTQAGTNTSVFNAVAVEDGNVYAAGSQSGNSQFNYGGIVTATGAYSSNNNVVLVKYNSNGAAQWAQSTQAASGVSQFAGIAIDDSYNVYAAGSQNGAGQFTYGSSASAQGADAGSNNIVLVKYRE